MKRLTYWNCREKGSALPVQINDDGDVVDIETICAKLAAYEDTGLEPEEIKAAWMNRYICQRCGRFYYLAASPATAYNDNCAYPGCDGHVVPAPESQKCRVCGCTWDHACPGGCYWVEPDLCSRCAEKEQAKSSERRLDLLNGCPAGRSDRYGNL